MIGLVLVGVLGPPALTQQAAAATLGVGPKRAEGATGNLTVVIDGPGPTADVGVPFTLTASLGDAIGPFVYIWSCPTLGATHAANWTVRLTQPGAARFSLEVGDSSGNVGWTNATINATFGPLLAASSTNLSADAGVATGVAFAVSGGVAPYALTWRIEGWGSNGSASLSSAGRFVEPVWTNATGPVWVATNVTDAVGGTDSAAAWVAVASPRPTLALAIDPPIAEVGAPLRVVGAVAGGDLPIRWTVAPGLVVGNASGSNGSLTADGDFAWGGTPAEPGLFAITGTVTDALGVVARENVSISVVAPVNLTLALLNRSVAAGGTLNLSGLVGGGVPPYVVTWSLSDGAHASENLASAGPVNWSGPAGTGGFVTAALSVRDAAGGVVAAQLSVLVPAPAVPPAAPVDPGADPTAGIVAALGVMAAVAAVGGGGFWWYRRNRHTTTSARQARADAFVAATVRSRHGIDADDLQGLGDAQSFFAEEIDEAVHRQVAAGRVRVEYDTGDPVYHWATPAEVPARPDDAAEAP